MKKIFVIVTLFLFSTFGYGSEFEVGGKFECPLRKTKIIKTQIQDYPVNEKENDGSQKIVDAGDLKLSKYNYRNGLNYEELEFWRIYDRASVVVVADIVSDNNFIDEDMTSLFFSTLIKKVQLGDLEVYKDNTLNKYANKNEVFINIDANFLFNEKLNIPMWKLSEGYRHYHSFNNRQNTQSKKPFISLFDESDDVLALYSENYKKLNIEGRYIETTIIGHEGSIAKRHHICGNNKFLTQDESYIFFLHENESGKLEFMDGYSVFNSKHKGLLKLFLAHYE